MKPSRRSVSPFGLFAVPETTDPLDEFTAAVSKIFPLDDAKVPSQCKTLADMKFTPLLLKDIWDAPAHDAPKLGNLCTFLVSVRLQLVDKGLQDVVYRTMQKLFEAKTDLFLIDHHDAEHCEKMGWGDKYRDVVLFARERDTLVGGYFAPVTETEPGHFSEFVSSWVSSESPDRLLHFLDFCMGSKNPTFEHFLIFSHPALNRVVTNKTLLRELLEKTRSVLVKVSSPTWEKDLKAALGF
jgi:hypothetical protein